MLKYIFLVGSLLSFTASYAENLSPGSFKCFHPGQDVKYIRGICKYQARPFGSEIFNQLLRMAQRQMKDWLDDGAFNPNIYEPQAGEGRDTIVWWTDDTASNEALGRMLMANDHKMNLLAKERVIISATMYSFEEGRERDLGIEMSAFYGQRQLTEDPAEGEVFGGHGLFQVVAGIGNPLASFLNLGIKVANNKRIAERVTEVTYDCEVGTSCDYTHDRKHFFVTPVGTKDQDIGLHISAQPRLDANDPNKVELVGMNVRYSLPTGDESAPVDTITVYGHRNLMIRTDELYVLGSESTRMDVRTGQILGQGSTKAHRRFLILMTVKVLAVDDPQFKSYPDKMKQYQYNPPTKRYSREELDRLPHKELSLKEVLSSLDYKCVKNIATPVDFEKICGFYLTKMDGQFLNDRVRVKVMRGKGHKSIVPVESFKLGDLFDEKGWYRLPKMQASREGEHMRLLIELDSKTPRERKIRRRHNVKGVVASFRYNPGRSETIDFYGEEELSWIR